MYFKNTSATGTELEASHIVSEFLPRKGYTSSTLSKSAASSIPRTTFSVQNLLSIPPRLFSGEIDPRPFLWGSLLESFYRKLRCLRTVLLIIRNDFDFSDESVTEDELLFSLERKLKRHAFRRFEGQSERPWEGSSRNIAYNSTYSWIPENYGVLVK